MVIGVRRDDDQIFAAKIAKGAASTDIAVELLVWVSVRQRLLSLNPFMPQFVDMGRIDDSFLVLLMEQATSTLKDVISSKPSKERATALAFATAKALAALHQVGFTHQDIKPGNVLVDADGCALLADFGAAATFKHWTLSRAPLVGDASLSCVHLNAFTDRYAAPEVVDDGQMTARSDVWSWALVAIQLFGVPLPPKPRANIAALHEAIDRVGLDGALADLFKACLRRRPHERPDATRVVSQLELLPIAVEVRPEHLGGFEI